MDSLAVSAFVLLQTSSIIPVR